MPTTYALIPGAGGRAWYRHRVTPLLTARGAEAIAIDLPADDDVMPGGHLMALSRPQELVDRLTLDP